MQYIDNLVVIVKASRIWPNTEVLPPKLHCKLGVNC